MAIDFTIKTFFYSHIIHPLPHHQHQINLLYKYPRLIGGCIWEWADHSVLVEDEKGNMRYVYGGQCGEFPNDLNYCVDGLVFPDRTPSTGLLDAKQVYGYITAIKKNKLLTYAMI